MPMLKPGEYELWRMRMEQYIQMVDYSLWEVIENGNAPPITKVVKRVETTIDPLTAEEKAQRRNRESTKRNVPIETPASTTLMSCDGFGGYDWSDQAEEGLGYNVVPPLYTKNFMPSKPDLSGLEEFVNEPIVSEPTVKKLVVETSEAKASADKPKANACHYHQRQIPNQRVVKPNWNNANRVNHHNFPKKTHPSPKRSMVPKATLMRSGLVSVTTARPVNIAQPKTTVNSARPMSNVFNKAHSTVRRPIHKQIAFKNSYVNQKVNTVRSKTVNTARPKAVVNVVQGNVVNDVKALACWVWKPKTKVIDNVSKHNSASITLKKFDYIDAQGRSKVIDSGCLRHMTRNMSYLTVYEEINRGYVAFGGNPKRGKITGRAERRNRILIKAARTMLDDLKLPTTFWAEAINTACYMQNRVLVVKPYNKTPYELFNGRTPSLSFMRLFGCPVTILNTKDHLSKFDGKANEGFFVGYSINSKAFRVFNSRTRIVEENLHIRFNENTPNVAGSGPTWIFDIDALTKSMNYKPVVAGNRSNGNAGTKAFDDADDECQPSSNHRKKVDEVPRQESKCKDQEKENNDNNTNNVNVTGINRVNAVGANSNNELPFDPEMHASKDINTFNFLSNHEDDDQVADMSNLDTTIQVSPTPTARIHKDHPIDQMDVKSTFIYENIEEEVYVCKPLRFEDPDFPDKVYKVKKALYGLHQAPRACTPMETQKPLLKDEDDEEVDVHMYRSMIGSLMYLTSSRPDILFVVCACARYQVNPKVSHLHAVKRIFRKPKTRKTKRKDTELPQTSVPIKYVTDKAVNEEMDDSLERAATTATSLDAEQDRCNIFTTQSKATPNEPSSIETSSGGGPKRQDTMKDTIAQTRILDLEITKTTQALDIESLKRKVKKLEKKQRSITHKLKRLYKVGLSARVESSEDESLGEDDASKHKRIADINADEGITLVNETIKDQGRNNDEDMFGVNNLDGDEVIVENEDVAEQVKEDKGKGIMVEPKPVKKLSKKDQISLDEELAFKIQAEEEEERIAMKRINNFVDYITKLLEESSKKAQAELTQEGSSKRAGDELEQKRSKKQKVEDDKESEELKKCLEIIPDDGDDVTIDATPLSSKSSTIVEYKIHKEWKKSYF
uniref:Retrovirus-related Pol polyprotein from transposon TNT 1-94 n=1 Tax=Tanacetum cinerariifolium TaxID=118510 RepID=A0A6L2MUX3_TANCI|nr:retrovirus-related Pol polyprotein from transposon TNT 1-94 [Tanacetum cinerariifolium]